MNTNAERGSATRSKHGRTEAFDNGYCRLRCHPLRLTEPHSISVSSEFVFIHVHSWLK